MSALEAAERELHWVKEQHGAPIAPRLGCSTVSHDRLGFCAGCALTFHDRGPTGAQAEVLGWRLLALIEEAGGAPGRAQRIEQAVRDTFDERYLPPTHAGPCVESLDGDGEPLGYCVNCYQPTGGGAS